MKNLVRLLVILMSVGLLAWRQISQPAAEPSTQPTSRPSTVLEPVKEGAATKPAESTGVRYAEGTYLIDQLGKLAHDKKTGEARFVFEAGKKTLELGVMQNTTLARMEDALEANKDVRFKITAVATQYQDKNYLLIERAEMLSK